MQIFSWARFPVFNAFCLMLNRLCNTVFGFVFNGLSNTTIMFMRNGFRNTMLRFLYF